MIALMLIQIGNLFMSYYFLAPIISRLSLEGHDGVISQQESHIAVLILPVFASIMLGRYIRSMTNKWNEKFETQS